MKANLTFCPDKKVPEMVKIELVAETQEDSQELKILHDMKLIQGISNGCYPLKGAFFVPAKDDPVFG